jgi:hypothetical protein
MIIGTLISLVGAGLFAISATHPDTSYYTIAFYFILSSAGGGMAYVAWMASFTETVEKHNPAATATGLAIWGWILRLVVSVSLAALTFVVPATSTLVDQGTRVQEIVAAHPEEIAVLASVDPDTAAAIAADPKDVSALATALGEVATQQGASSAEAQAVSTAVQTRAAQLGAVQAIDPAVLAALQANPLDQAAGAQAVGQISAALGTDAATSVQLLRSLADPAVQQDLALVSQYSTVLTEANAAVPADDLAYLSAHADEVTQAQEDNPHQWQRWWWVCFAAQLLFLPFVFVMTGRWSPKKAKADEAEHERRVQEELAALQVGRA